MYGILYNCIYKMNFLIVSSVKTFLVDFNDQEKYENKYYDYGDIVNCYDRTNEVFVDFDSNVICINLHPTLDSNCN